MDNLFYERLFYKGNLRYTTDLQNHAKPESTSNEVQTDQTKSPNNTYKDYDFLKNGKNIYIYNKNKNEDKNNINNNNNNNNNNHDIDSN